MENSLVNDDPRVYKTLQMPWHKPVYRAMERAADRRYLLYDFILQPTSEEWRIFPLPAALSPLYYVLRPIRLAYRLVGKLMNTLRQG